MRDMASTSGWPLGGRFPPGIWWPRRAERLDRSRRDQFALVIGQKVDPDNVPDPNVPVYLCGAQLLAHCPLSLITRP